MSKQHRTKLIKSLEQQLEATTDPKIKADISRQLTKLLSKPTRKGSPRKPKATSPTSALRDLYPDCDHMSEDQLAMHHLVLKIEEKRRERSREYGRELTEAEKQAVTREVGRELTELEKQAEQQVK